MAALVVRSSEEKSLLSGLLFQPENVSRITTRGAAEEPPSRSAGQRSSRKSKSGVKKQPQRGLGVAQLEKLRLQEQSKQDAACLASLGLLHGHEFPHQGICFPHHHHHQALLGQRRGILSAVVNAGMGEIGDGMVWSGKEGDFQVDVGSIPVPVQLISPGRRTPESEMVKLPVSEMMKVQLFDPGSIPVHRRELPMVGIPKELSSFQTKLQGGNYTHNNSSQVWQAAHSATSGTSTKRPPSSCTVLLQDVVNPRVLISVDHGEIVQTEPGDGPPGVILNTTAHYTPRSISNALGKSTSLPFLKPEEQSSVLAEQPQAQYHNHNHHHHHHHPADSMSSASSVPFLQRKRCMPFSDSSNNNNNNNSASKKAATSGGVAGCGSDFLALSLSISHTDVVEHQSSGKSGDDSLLQRSLSLQETVTDVDEGSQKSPSSYGNGGNSMDTTESPPPRPPPPPPPPLQLGFSYPAKSCSSSGNSKRNSGVDLSLKLAI